MTEYQNERRVVEESGSFYRLEGDNRWYEKNIYPTPRTFLLMDEKTIKEITDILERINEKTKNCPEINKSLDNLS